MAADESLLVEVPFFKTLDNQELTALTAMLEEVRLTKGQVLFKFGDPGDTLYLIRNGRLELFATDHGGTKISFPDCVSGDFIGELSLFDNGPRTATVVAAEDTELLALRRAELLAFLQRQPKVAVNMLTVMGQRFRNTHEQLRQRVTRNVNEELADKRTVVEKISDWIAAFSGSIPFLLLHLMVFAFWILWNIGGPTDPKLNWLGLPIFDPYPFGLLTMEVSMEAIILSVFVLISQNRQIVKDRIRSDIEYEVNLKAESEVAHLHTQLENMHAEVVARLHNLEKAQRLAWPLAPQPELKTTEVRVVEEISIMS